MNKFDPDEHIIFHKKYEYNSKKSIPFFGAHLTEIDILILQDLFMTNGVHRINTLDFISGRTVTTIILDSLKHYQNVACISDMPSTDHLIKNIYHEICVENACHDNMQFAFEKFFIEQPFFDFLIIELTETFKNEKLIQNLFNIFSSFHFQEQLPIILISYEQ